jgi:RNA polymerase sigma-70 factor (ECF subfamily)
MSGSAVFNLRLDDAEQYACLYREFHPRVLRLCHYLLGSREEAEDAASEVFARLPRALRTYDRSQPFWGWLSMVVRHYCVDLLRRRKAEQRLFEPEGSRQHLTWEPATPGWSPLEQLVAQETREAVRNAVVRLPERYRAPLMLQYYSDLSYSEIAERLGLTRGNVAVLVFRAKKQLRRNLARGAAA